MQFRAGKFVVKNFTFILKGISHWFFLEFRKEHNIDYNIVLLTKNLKQLSMDGMCNSQKRQYK